MNDDDGENLINRIKIKRECIRQNRVHGYLWAIILFLSGIYMIVHSVTNPPIAY